MKLPLTMFLLAASVPLIALALTPEPAASEPAADELGPRDGEEFDGTIGGWMVLEDGRVQVRLHLDSGGDRWFETPPSQSSTTQFELLALHAILALDESSRLHGAKVFIRGESTSEKDGESASDAMQLTAIGRR